MSSACAYKYAGPSRDPVLDKSSQENKPSRNFEVLPKFTENKGRADNGYLLDLSIVMQYWYVKRETTRAEGILREERW